MEKYLKEIPKIELHLHLDGSVRVGTASKLLGRDVTKEMIVDRKVKSLNDYLEKFDLPLGLMQTVQNIEMISEELAIDLKNENVIYAEVRFAPMKHLEKGLDMKDVVEAVLKGLNKVDIKTNLILCTMRGESYKVNEKVIRLAKKYLNKGVCAVDLAGAEALFKTEEYRYLFSLARSLDIPFTIHAGEADGIESIESALNFGAKRIGHGVRIVESKRILQKAINNKVTLEICPTSNIDTGIFTEYKNHNIRQLYEQGLKVTINTDNRTVSNITLTGEYQKLEKTFGFTVKDFIIFNLNAIDAAFISEREKEKLRNELKDFIKINKLKVNLSVYNDSNG